MFHALGVLALALPTVTAQTTVVDALVFPQWDTQNLTASVVSVEKSVTTWVYGCKSPATFCGYPEGATVVHGPGTFVQNVSFTDSEATVGQLVDTDRSVDFFANRDTVRIDGTAMLMSLMTP